MLPLFDEAPSFDRARLGARLRELTHDNIWIGTSSWKYEGWLGQIYSRDRYTTRGRFSKKRFEAECLAEYAETFPIVCGDFSFYQFPTPEFWTKLFSTAPTALKFALKAPEEVTVEVFPRHARYGQRAGMQNEAFLNADALDALFLDPLRAYQARLAPIVFEFGARSTSPREFVQQLGGFLEKLPRDMQFGVEVRNREFLRPEYFDTLRQFGVAHVLNAWTKMPALSEQISLPQTAPFTIVRALLRQGRPYEEAVQKFQPYDRVQDENPEAREALRSLLKRMKEERKSAYVFVNNRLEGNAPSTIESIAF